MFRSTWLTIDVGNSSTKIGLFSGDDLVKTANGGSAEEVLEIISGWQADTPIVRIGLCSVVPQKSDFLLSGIKQLSGAPFFCVNSGVNLPLQIGHTPAGTLGPDRLAAACYAAHNTAGAHIIIDAGTAITIDAVNENKTFLGGVIMPGPEIANLALTNYTAQLPEIPLTLPDGALGRSTDEALQHGIVHGTVDGVMGAIVRIREALASNPTITITGGWHSLLVDKIPEAKIAPHLVLHGIRLLMQFNPQSA
ncbi:MAG: type III pantothenate kinase [Rhodothermaceae bacterium]|nr:type III pantothenate kinase [Rhodothermaceae bacterium]MYF64092.1 type III pantothenate kinase [Rhodothermaceae bacterium]MYI84038.1 type III pantothenate kinase [Rhodothermaceae bacterium]